MEERNPRPRVAVIGVGHWHLPLYVPGLAEADVVGVWDPDHARADQLARSIGSVSYGSRSALLGEDLDLAFVFGDPWEMLDRSQACLSAGVPFSVEKPAAPSLEELDALETEAGRAAVTAFVPLVLRASGVSAVVEQLGLVTAMTAQYLTGTASRYSGSGFGWALEDAVLGAGCLDNLGPQFVDLFSLAVASPWHTLEHVRISRPDAGAADDRALVVLGSPGGASATLTLGYTTPHPQLSVGPQVVITGTAGTLVLSDADARLLHPDGSTSRPCPPLTWPSLFTAYVRMLLSSPGGGGGLATLTDLRNAYAVLQQSPGNHHAAPN